MTCLKTTHAVLEPLRTLALVALLALTTAGPARADTFDVSQWDPILGDYVSIGTITPYATPDSFDTWYGYDGNHFNLAAGAPTPVSDRVHLLLLDSDTSGLCLVYLVDAVGDGSDGRTELAVTLTGSRSARWLLQDDPFNVLLLDDYTGEPGEVTFAALHGWNTTFADGGVIGNLDGCPSQIEVVFTDLDSPPDPGNELDGLSSLAAYSGDGGVVDLVLDVDRPVRITPRPGHRISQLDPTTGLYEVLGCVEAFTTSDTVATWYGYDGNHYNVGAGVPDPTSDRSHLMLVQSDVEGLNLVYLHDRTSDGSGGRAEMAFTIDGDGNGVGWTLQDDPFNVLLVDDYTGGSGDSAFTNVHAWNTVFADGGALGPLDSGWDHVDVAFSDFDGSPGDEMDGLAAWAALSADGSEVALTLDVDRPVRIDACCHPGNWSDIGCALAGTAGEPRLTGTGTVRPDSVNWLSLNDARPSALTLLALSLGSTPVPFKGGTLCAFPIVVSVTLSTFPDGTIDFPFVWGPGVPAGGVLCFQYLIDDPGAVFGVALSNAACMETENL